MSDRRAWVLVEELSRLAGSPVVRTERSGAGGCAHLTERGKAFLAAYRGPEADVAATSRDWLNRVAELQLQR